MGRRYYVSCRQLGVKPETKEASLRAANQWWRDTQASIDLAYSAAHPPYQPTPLEDLASALHGGRWKDLSELQEMLRKNAGLTPPAATQPVEAIAESQVAGVLGELLHRAILYGEPFPDTLLAGLPPARAQQIRDAVTMLRGGNAAAPGRTVAEMVSSWLAKQQHQVAIGGMSADRVRNLRPILSHFAAFVGETADVAAITAEVLDGFHSFCLSKIAEKHWSPSYSKEVFAVAKQWTRYLTQLGAIQVPANLHARWRFGSMASAVATFTVDEVQQLTGAASGKLKLALLLMLNCGMTQQDVSDLADVEVNWQAGRVRRKRSKTRHVGSVPTVEYPLWPATLALLKEYRSGTDRVLVTKSGGPFLRKDTGSDMFARLYEDLRERVGIPKPMKLLRKTSASLLESHEVYGRFTSLFLGHSPRSMKDRHYAAPPQELFDAAIVWLGERLGQFG